VEAKRVESTEDAIRGARRRRMASGAAGERRSTQVGTLAAGGAESAASHGCSGPGSRPWPRCDRGAPVALSGDRAEHACAARRGRALLGRDWGGQSRRARERHGA
jgi:hypothetical protein